MKTKVKFGLGQAMHYAPKWVINIMSVITLLLTAKHYLINDIPGLKADSKLLVMEWADYILNAAQVLLALVVIFSGEHKAQEDKDDTTGINYN
jgi:hypothetical protein